MTTREDLPLGRRIAAHGWPRLLPLMIRVVIHRWHRAAVGVGFESGTTHEGSRYPHVAGPTSLDGMTTIPPDC